MNYFLLPDGGNGISLDGTLPAGAVACTQAQYENAESWTLQNGQPVAVTVSAAQQLAAAQAAQSALMQVACKAQIEGGFSSSALGSAYNYPSDRVSQQNIALATVSGGSLWCETGSTWSFVSHTVAQAQQVQKDLVTHIQAAQSTYAGVLGQIAAATTVAAVQAITW